MKAASAKWGGRVFANASAAGEPAVDLALEAANLALNHGRLKAGRGLAAIELRDPVKRRPPFDWARLEPGASLGVALGALALVVVCWCI